MWNCTLTHWGRNKMDSISQTTFWSAFSWMKMFKFRITFHWSLFLRVQLTIIQHWFRQWLGAVQATGHYLNQWCLDYRRIYASLGLNELNRVYSVSHTYIHLAIYFIRRDCSNREYSKPQTKTYFTDRWVLNLALALWCLHIGRCLTISMSSFYLIFLAKWLAAMYFYYWTKQQLQSVLNEFE